MKCPYCNEDNTGVIDFRPADDNSPIRRRRQCERCGKRSATYEELGTMPLMVIKKDNPRETYDRVRIEADIVHSCHKRPVSIQQINSMIDETENQILDMEEKEAEISIIGELVMAKLKEVGEVAYVRFASVYREFKDANTFMEEIGKLLKKQVEIMSERFYPKKQVDSAYEISYKELYERGIRGVIFDIDNTLVFHGAPADEWTLALFQESYRMGVGTCFLSNNKEPRMTSLAGQVGSPYIYRGGKPGIGGYEKAMEKTGTERETVVFVGDQLSIDVYGANRAGIHSYLVKPIHPKKEIQVAIKRWFEAIVSHFHHRKCERESRES